MYGDCMSFSEFPHAHYQEYDNHELIILVKRLESEYSEILDKARKAESDAASAVSKVDSYMTTIDARITRQVNTAVEQATLLLKNDFQNINRRFNELQNDFSALTSDVRKAEMKIDSIASKMESDLDAFKFEIRAEVSKRIAKTEKEVAEKLTALDNLTATRMLELSEQIVLAMNMVKEESKNYTDDAVMKYCDDVNSSIDTRLEAILETITEIKESQIYNHVGWLWNNLCSMGGFSAIEIYDYGNFNVDMWNASEITCKEWFTSGKQKLGYNSGRMFDTMSGRFAEVGAVVNELISVLNAQGIIKNGFNVIAMKEERRGRKW